MTAGQEPTAAVDSSASETCGPGGTAFPAGSRRRGLTSGGVGLVILLGGMIAACSRSPVQPTGGTPEKDPKLPVSQSVTPPTSVSPGESPPSVSHAGKNPDGSTSSESGWRPARGEDPPVQVAMAFWKSLSAGTPQLDLLTADFLRIVGRPWEQPTTDRERGYSVLAAESWLRRTGRDWTLSSPIGTVGREWAFLSGSALREDTTGQYYLLLRLEGEHWKVDHLVVSSAAISWSQSERKGPVASGERNGQDQLAGWTLHCWLAALADRKAMSGENRAVLVAAALSPKLRQEWADPFDSDRMHGYDFNRGRLQLKITALIGNLEQFHLQPLDPPRHWQIEGKGGNGPSKRWVLTLEQDPRFGRWLIQRLLETP